jgi:hypothetical protein
VNTIDLCQRRREQFESLLSLELLICTAIALAMLSIALRSNRKAEQHVRVLEAISISLDARTEMMEYRAVNGVWPTSVLSPTQVQGIRVRPNGAVDLTLSMAGQFGEKRVVTIRAAENPAGKDLPIAWICGHARFLPLHPPADDATTFNDSELPSPCVPQPKGSP